MIDLNQWMVHQSGVIKAFQGWERAMPIERPREVPLGMPSPEALQMATDAVRRRYVLAETMQHPEIRAECLRLAYLVQAYGLAPTRLASHDDSTEKPRDADTAAWRLESRSEHLRHRHRKPDVASLRPQDTVEFAVE
jgi:hypothetical protein